LPNHSSYNSTQESTTFKLQKFKYNLYDISFPYTTYIAKFVFKLNLNKHF
jgi:hypothetical protein